MLEIEVYEVDKKPARTSKREWIEVIYTRRGWEVWMRREVLSMVLKQMARVGCNTHKELNTKKECL